MNRRAAPRIQLACLTLLMLAACVVNVDFDYAENNKSISAVATGNSLNSTFSINLAESANIQQHAANIDSLSITGVDLIVDTVQSDNSIQTVSGTVFVRPSTATDASQDIEVGALNSFMITAQNSVHFTETAAVDAFALATVKGSQSFIVVIQGTTTGGQTADFSVDFSLSLSMAYDTGI